MEIKSIGRSSSNDVNINDPLVSRAHCRIIQDDNGEFRLIDTNSKNGTYINGIKRHGEIRLKETDIVRIGNSILPWLTYFDPIIVPTPGPEPLPPPSQKPNNFLVWAILATIFCCVPFGIVSIVYASKVDRLWYAGDYDEAEEAACKARTWFWWAFGIGLGCHLCLLIYYIFIVGVVFLS